MGPTGHGAEWDPRTTAPEAITEDNKPTLFRWFSDTARVILQRINWSELTLPKDCESLDGEVRFLTKAGDSSEHWREILFFQGPHGLWEFRRDLGVRGSKSPVSQESRAQNRCRQVNRKAISESRSFASKNYCE